MMHVLFPIYSYIDSIDSLSADTQCSMTQIEFGAQKNLTGTSVVIEVYCCPFKAKELAYIFLLC